MSELWTPQPNKHPDVTNLYDMMMVFQEKLDTYDDHKLKIEEAKFAMKALGTSLSLMDDEVKQVSVVTSFVVLDSIDNDETGIITQDVGLNGILDDIHCIQIRNKNMVSVSLGIDVVTMFSTREPTELTYAMTNAKAPIDRVQYIETLVS